MSDNQFPGRCYSKRALPGDTFDLGIELEYSYAKEAKNYSRKLGVYHPSSLHPQACRRALYYDRIGITPKRSSSFKARKLFKLGHIIHDGIQATLEKMFPGFEPEPVIAFEALNIYGHADGVLREKDWVIELKSIGDASYKVLVKPQKKHLWQVTCYMAALDIPRTQLLYINRNTGDMRLFRVRFDVEIWEQIVQIIRETEAAVTEGVAPLGLNKSYTCRQCKFKHHCEPICLTETHS
jgi:CRISPR/Cas system-associated exonuclease Cas4 (RecB family)